MKPVNPEVIASRAATLRDLNLAWVASLDPESPIHDMTNTLYDASDIAGAALSGDLGKKVIEAGRAHVLPAHD